MLFNWLLLLIYYLSVFEITDFRSFINHSRGDLIQVLHPTRTWPLLDLMSGSRGRSLLSLLKSVDKHLAYCFIRDVFPYKLLFDALHG